MLCDLCMLGGPQRQARGPKAEVATSPLPSRGAKRGRKCFATPEFSGVPNATRGEQNQKLLPHPCLDVRPKRGRKCYITLAFSGVSNTKRGEQNQKLLPHPCLDVRPKRGRKCYVTPASSGGPNAKRREQISKVAISPMPSRGGQKRA